MNKRHASHAGFTLVEFIIYIAITTMVVVALLNVMISVLGNMEKINTTSAVQQELRYSMERIAQTALTARSLHETGSVFNTSNGTLSFFMSGAALNPTTFFLSGSSIYMSEGGVLTGALTTSAILVDTFQVTNRTATGAFATVRVELHGTDTTTTADTTYNDSMTLQSSFTLRQ